MSSYRYRAYPKVEIEARNTTQYAAVAESLSSRTYNSQDTYVSIIWTRRIEQVRMNAAQNILQRGLETIRAGNQPQPEEKGAPIVRNNGKHHSLRQEAIYRV
ncbi:MAG TPA: hypothetical protein VK436_09270 [Methanocella sp.]|nr:hypothetical protein [Methanocella sp.]